MREKTIIYTVELTDIVKEPYASALDGVANNWFNRTDELGREMQGEAPLTLTPKAAETKKWLEEKIAEIMTVDNANLVKLQVFERTE